MNVEGLRRVHEISANLAAVVKSARLYQPGHRSVREMLERTYGFMSAFLDDYIALELEIDAAGMKWEGKPLVQSGDQEFDFLFRFYRDGVRQITFVQGLPFAELESFLGLILQECPADQDLATLAWRRDFLYIQFAIVEAFHRLLQQDTEEEKRSVMREVDAWAALASRERLDPPPAGRAPAEAVEGIIPPGAFEPKPREGNPPLDAAREGAVEEVIGRLLTALGSPQETTVGQAARNLRLLADTLLRQADLDLLGRLLDMLPGDSPRGEVRDLRDLLMGVAALERLAAHFLQEEKWPELALALFCNRLDDAALLRFLRPLLASPPEKMDPLLARLMRYRGDALAALAAGLDPGRVRTLLRIAKETGGDPLLDRFAGHAAAEVRLEVLRMRDAPTDAHLEAALKDPDREVRLHALALVSRERRSALARALTEGIRSGAFADHDAQERERWVMVTAMVGRERVEEFFIHFLESKGLLVSAREEEMKALAARALGIIGGERSLPVLQRESKRLTSPSRVRESCALSREVILKKRKPHE